MTVELNQAYELGAIVGEGGGGRVYRARQRSTGQEVAVKILAAAGEARRTRFRREMRACARLQHPSIVSLIDYGECDDGQCFLAFDYVPGETLATVLAEGGSLPVARALRLARELLDALAHSHSLGVIHRDVKPSNLMLSGDPIERLQVLDFGTAAFTEAAGPVRPRLTAHGEVLGTPAYAAPEQLRGDSPSARSDLYSWGLVLLECLTGENPMSGPSVGEVFARQLAAKPVPLPAGLMDHPLGHILHWAVQKEVASRASDARELLRMLDSLETADLVDAAGFLREGRSEKLVRGWVPVAETAEAGVAPTESRALALVCVRVGSASQADDGVRRQLLDTSRAQMENAKGVWVAGLGDTQLFAFGLDATTDYVAHSTGRAALRVAAQAGGERCGITVGIHVINHTPSDASAEELAMSEGAGVAVGLAQSAFGTVDSARVQVSAAFQELAGRAFSFEQAISGAIHLVGILDSDYDELTRFVGRQTELEAVRRAAQVPGSVVWLRGPPGIGKSRFVRELQATHSRLRAAVRLRHVAELQHVALGAVLQLLQEELLPTEPAIRDVAALLREYDVFDAERVSVLAVWLGLALVPPYVPLPHSPQTQRALLYSLLSDLIAKLCVRRKGFLLVEDLHWTDFSSKAWLEQLLLRLCEDGTFALLTSREGVELAWERVAPRRLDLAELGEAASRQLVDSIRGVAELPSATLKAITERGAGTPLFIEELTLAALRGDASTEAIELPSILRDVMARQLDRLGAAKPVVRVASAIGSEFELELLAAATAPDNRELLPHLERLVSYQVLQRVPGTDGATRFAFRHSLLRDAAYASIPPSQAREVHLRLGDLLSSTGGLTNPGRAARHYQQAGDFAAAIPQFLAASARALSVAAAQEAQAETEMAFACLDGLTDQSLRDVLELDLIRQALACVFQMGASLPEENVALLERGSRLLERVPLESNRAFLFRWTTWEALHLRPDQRAAQPLAEQLVQQAEVLGTPFHRLAAADAAGRTAFFMGNLPVASAHFKSGISLHDPAMSAELGRAFVIDPVVNCYSFQAINQLLKGEVALAAKTYARAVEYSRRAGAFGAVAGVLATASAVSVLGQLEESAVEFVEDEVRLAESVELAAKYGQPIWGTMAQAWGGIIAAMRGSVEALEALAAQLPAMVDMHGSSLFVVPVARLLSDRDPSQAIRLLEQFDVAAERRAEGFLQAESSRIRARALRNSGANDRALGAAECALALARSQGATLLEARAAEEVWRASPPGAARDAAQAQLATLLRALEKRGAMSALSSLAQLMDSLDG